MGIGTDTRITYKRRHSFNTRSNKIRKIRTPGGKLTIQYVEKKAKGPTCQGGSCRKALQGIPRARPHDYKLMKKSQRTVSRAYGGVLCAACLRDRVMRAFIVEEQKTVKVYAKSA